MTLTETLRSNGYTHSRVGQCGAHVIYKSGDGVFIFSTDEEVWDWLWMLNIATRTA